MAEYQLTFTTEDFEDFPEITMDQAVFQKFNTVYGIVVDETNIAKDVLADGSEVYRHVFGLNSVTITMDDGVVPFAAMTLDIESDSSPPALSGGGSISVMGTIGHWIKKVFTFWKWFD